MHNVKKVFQPWLDAYLNDPQKVGTLELIGNRPIIIKIIKPCFSCLVRPMCLRNTIQPGKYYDYRCDKCLMDLMPKKECDQYWKCKQHGDKKFVATVNNCCERLLMNLQHYVEFIDQYWHMDSYMELQIKGEGDH